MRLNKIIEILVITFALVICSLSSYAQYPDKPVKLVVGFPPGGGGDLFGRTIAAELSKQIGQTIVVENKPGAGGNIAAEFVANAKPDGYTLLLAMSGNFASSPASRSDLPYKVPGSFEPISLLVETPFGLMVGANSKITTIQEFVTQARLGKMTYASTGTGGAAQMVMEMVKQQANLNILHIPYKGSGPAITDLISGQVDSFFAPYTPLMGQITGGKIRLLAVSSPKRVASMPNIPTLKESGINVTMTQWYGLAAPAGTPKEVISTLTKGVKTSLQQQAVLKVFRADGAREAYLPGEEFKEFIQTDIATYRRIIMLGGLKND